MASKHKRGEKWLVKWRDPDGTERTRTCPDRATAVELQRDVERARARGLRWAPSEATKAPPLTEARDGYLRWRTARKRANTIYADQTAMDRFDAFLRSKYPRARTIGVDHLNHAELEEFDLSIRGVGEGKVSVRSATAYTLIVRRWWAWVYAQEPYRPHIQAPPESQVLDLPRPIWVPPHAPTWVEMDKAIGAAGRRAWVRDALTLLRYTGLRQGQVMGLRWEDFDLDRAQLEIRPELGKSRAERAGRTIPISPHLVGWLAGRGIRDGYVVAPHKLERELHSATDTGPAWVRSGVREAAWKGHPAHAFRYGFTTGLKQAGADSEAVEHLVGHAINGARSYYLDPRWGLSLRAAVALVPGITTEVQLDLVRG